MNLHQVAQPRTSVNGFGRRRMEKETGTRKAISSRLTSAGVPADNKGGGESPSRERLVFLTTCLIGHQVDVQVTDGSVFSGIFHATNADKDFGVILKMARLAKASSSRGQKSILDSVNKPPSKTLIIPAKELVQITAKSVSITRNGLTNELQREKQQEILIDSSISQSRHVDLERELERWVPDEDTPECPELDTIFDGQWNRGWDQFEANETLFGVKSTFNEDLYTTKLDRGPQMRELEREALRIAREIEGEDTKDLHLAEERGINFHDMFDIDEETRFSSVIRGVDDSGYNDDEDMLDSNNLETFGDVSGSITSQPFTNLTSGKSNNDALVSSNFPSMGEVQSFKSSGRDIFLTDSNDHVARSISDLDDDNRIQENFNVQKAGSTRSKEDKEKHMLAQGGHSSKTDDSQSSQGLKKESFDKGVLSPNATAYAPSRGSSTVEEKTTSSELSETAASVKTHGSTQAVVSRARPGSSVSSTSDCGNAVPTSSGPGLSPSSSMGSLSSEKSGLNPHAKEFRLNPNAKSFVPTQAPLRPASPASDGSFYYPANVNHAPPIHGMPLGMGIGPSFAPHRPVVFGPQAASLQSPQAYYHPNGPQYGQQMMLGQPRQVLYMPTYPPEMQYKGRDY